MGTVIGYRHLCYINSIMPARVGAEMCVLGYIMYAEKRSSSKTHESRKCPIKCELH